MNEKCVLLELMNCEITPLGCEFLLSPLNPDPMMGSKLEVLKLDYNNGIGNAGIKILAENLCKNKSLLILSLAYCGITGAEGGRILMEIMIYQQSGLQLINLSGNQFDNEGIVEVFKGLAANKSLNNVMLCDCHWEDT